MHFNPRKKFIGQLVYLLMPIFASLPGYAQSDNSACGSLSVKRGGGGVGPFDYQTEKPSLEIVEKYHFTPAVEALIRGSTNALPGADLDYTLRAIPNHHRALMAMMRYGEKMKSPTPAGAHYSVECYFDRALRFRPNDTIVRMLYATFLSKNARRPEAIQQLELATVASADNAFSQYNIGLIYFDLKDYDRALTQAHKAIALGFPQTALREKLRSAGKWTDPSNKPLTTPETEPSIEPVDASNPPVNNATPEANPK